MTTTRVRVGTAAMLIAATALTACSTDEGPTNATLGDTSVTSPTTSPTTSSSASDASADASATASETATPTTGDDWNAPVSEVPAPANSATMKCREFSELDKSTQVAVLKALGANPDPERLSVAANLLSVGCMGFPEVSVADALAGNLPE